MVVDPPGMPDSSIVPLFITAQALPEFDCVRSVPPVAVTLMLPAKLLYRVMGTSAYTGAAILERQRVIRAIDQNLRGVKMETRVEMRLTKHDMTGRYINSSSLL